MTVQLMIKPVGASCNLDCRYCFYLDRDRLVAARHHGAVDESLLETIIAAVIAARGGERIEFAWQGGEPLLLGLETFRRILDLQRRLCPPGCVIANVLQTNGMLIDEAWASFFKENGFLIGVSIDGPARLHDGFRRDKRGLPTHHQVVRGIRLLRDHGVAFNAVCVVHARNWCHGAEIYKALRRLGIDHMQFIPAVERAGPGPDPAVSAESSPESVPPAGYGVFLTAVFQTWIRCDVGTVFVREFETALALRLGLPSPLCVFAETCGRNMVVESNGEVFACDHYVYPSHSLGHIGEMSLTALAELPRQHAFGEAKRDGLPPDCLSCPMRPLCNGGCPKHRFARASDGSGRLNHLCPSYKAFLNAAGPYLTAMARLLALGRAPAEVMRLVGKQGRSRHQSKK
ncbi:MAG: anaerobic sulfatase maturase [Rhodospirillales bacterium]|nr:anaerobic sulfatase maturase [Rhodospirillales bacterium]